MKNFKDLGVEDYLQLFWRRKWYFLLTFILVGAGTTVYAFRQKQFYRSDTKIMVAPAAVPEDYVRPVDRSSPQDRINSIRAQLDSRTFLTQVIEQNQLFGFGSGPEFRIENAVNALRASIRVDIPTYNTFTLSFHSTDPQSARDVTKKLADALIKANVSANKNTTIETDQFVDEQLRLAERDLAAQEERIKEYKTSHLGALPEQGAANLNVLTALQTQLAAMEGQIDRARGQQKLLELRRQEQERLGVLTRDLFSTPAETKSVQPDTPAAAAGSVNPLEQQLALKRADLASSPLRPGHPDYDKLAREVSDLEQRIAAINATRKNTAAATPLTPLGAQTDAGAAVAAARTVVDANALPVDLASAEIRMEMESLKDEIAKRERERAGFLQQIKQVQTTLNMTPAIEQELMALTRDREVLQQRYKDLQNKKFNSQMAASLATDVSSESYKIIDEANLPERPAFPDRKQIILMGLAAGFFLGLAAAVGREYLDPTLGSEHEAAAALNVPVLICIPEIAEPRRPRRGLLPRKAS